MSKIKLTAFILAILLTVGLGTVVKIQSDSIDKLKTEIVISNNNFNALQLENSNLNDLASAYQLTVEQLNNTKDSLTREMNSIRKQLKVKDKELKELAYIASTASRIDTIILEGEPIKENVHIDTTISDVWYSLSLQIDSPNKVSINPEYKSEKYIITSVKRETTNPSKCKLLNFFRKKESVIEIDVIEKNPYIINNKEKFIETIKK